MLDKDSLYNNESKNEVENLKAFLPALIFSGIYAYLFSFKPSASSEATMEAVVMFFITGFAPFFFTFILSGIIKYTKRALGIHKDNWSLIFKHCSLIIPFVCLFQLGYFDNLNFITLFLFQIIIILFVYFTSTKNTLDVPKKIYYLKLFFSFLIITGFIPLIFLLVFTNII